MAYFANSDSADVLGRQCADCPLGCGWNNPKQKKLFDADSIPRPCPTAFVQLMYNYDQRDNSKLREAMSALISDDGICQTRKLLIQIRSEE